MLPERRQHEIDGVVHSTLSNARAMVQTPTESIFTIAQNCEYTLRKYSEFSLEEIIDFFLHNNCELPPGIYLRQGQAKIIFYNDLLSINEISYTIAHELGHGELRHCIPCSLAEREADYFADSLLAQVSGVNPVKPISNSKITLKDFSVLGKWGIILLGAAFIYYVYKKQTAKAA